MKPLPFKFIAFFAFISISTYGQDIAANSCDSSGLTKKEFERCLADTAWNANIVTITNYITGLKTEVLPRYRKLRKEFKLSPGLSKPLRELKIIYDTVLNNKLSRFLYEMDKNQSYVQPKAYISSLLSLQTFRFYPDVYAILLNEIHLKLSPKSSVADLDRYSQLIDNIYNSISSDLHQQLEELTISLANEKTKLMTNGFSPQFQGIQSDSEKKKFRIINFLLWTE